MKNMSHMTLPSIVAATTANRDAFTRLTDGIPYERKGILYSEMFFLWLCANPLKPKRILESGRARGQSTLILSRIFPDAEILSIEFDRNSPDVPVAAARLKDCANVRQLFGDATKMLPEMLAPGDIVLIDGPKGFRGLRLALQLVGDSRPAIVFMHDTLANGPEREFLERHLPNTLYSDVPELAAKTHDLDDGRNDLPPELRFGPDCRHYGYSLAAMTRPDAYGHRATMLRAIMAGFAHRLGRKKGADA